MDYLSEVMIYVKDMEKAVRFWKEGAGFISIKEQSLIEGYKSVELKPSKDAQTSIVLFDLEFIRKYSPEVAENKPSLMFKTSDLEGLRGRLMDFGSEASEIVTMGDIRVFNFNDGEDNYFVVKESF